MCVLLITGEEFNCSTYDGTEDEAKILTETPTVITEGSGEEETTGGNCLSETSKLCYFLLSPSSI